VNYNQTLLFYVATDGVSITNSNCFCMVILIRIRTVIIISAALRAKVMTPWG
jgi:hypothetical protein